MGKKQKIFVGISGGVDSSVAAYLLKKEGYDVHGVFIKTWSPEWLPCTWIDEKRDAMRVCAALDIPFHFLDAEPEYKQGVADFMIEEYRAGRTPNPDVLCNRVIKFGVLWDYVQKQGGTAIATGHYAQIKEGKLCIAADETKDQSYFLWMLRDNELAHIRFPIGHLTKTEVRSIAEKAKLFTATKKDSQGICFLGDIDMREFLSHYIQEQKGDVVDETGTVIGDHDGVLFYTLGERHGFRITAPPMQREPQYVVSKDIEGNKLIVSPRIHSSEQKGQKQEIELRDINWIVPPKIRKKYDIQIRYHGNRISAMLKNKTTIIVASSEVISPGQSLVIYEKQVLMGGGIMHRIEPHSKT
jgi:tRNA-uridine 2-sulfurtransferase